MARHSVSRQAQSIECEPPSFRTPRQCRTSRTCVSVSGHQCAFSKRPEHATCVATEPRHIQPLFTTIYSDKLCVPRIPSPVVAPCQHTPAATEFPIERRERVAEGISSRRIFTHAVEPGHTRYSGNLNNLHSPHRVHYGRTRPWMPRVGVQLAISRPTNQCEFLSLM